MTEQTTAPVPGSPEHDAAMIALAEAQGVRIRTSNAQSGEASELTTITGQGATTPQLGTDAQITPPEQKSEEIILGKFKTQADLIAAYQELERAQSQAKPAVAVPTAVKPAAALQPEASELTAEQKAAQAELTAATTPEAKLAAQAKLDIANAAVAKAAEASPAITLDSAMAKAAADFDATGTISDEGYAQLQAVGISRQTADLHVEGLKARAEVLTMKVYNEAGGKDQFDAMVSWVAANWTPAQIEAHNRAVMSGQLEATLGAIKTMKAAYTADQGTEPQTRVEPQGGASNTTPVEMYRSSAEMQKDMNDPRYLKGDRVFHALVDRKIEAAMRANVDLGI